LPFLSSQYSFEIESWSYFKSTLLFHFLKAGVKVQLMYKTKLNVVFNRFKQKASAMAEACLLLYPSFAFELRLFHYLLKFSLNLPCFLGSFSCSPEFERESFVINDIVFMTSMIPIVMY
jgi:hypothetical protein